MRGLDGKMESHLVIQHSTVRDNISGLSFVTYRDGVWKYDGTNFEKFRQ